MFRVIGLHEITLKGIFKTLEVTFWTQMRKSYPRRLDINTECASKHAFCESYKRRGGAEMAQW